MAAQSEDDLRRILAPDKAEQPLSSEQVRQESLPRAWLFQSPLDFSYQRSVLQAFGWYLIFCLIGFVLIDIARRLLVGDLTGSPSQVISMALWVNVPYSVLLAIALLRSRWRRVTSILLASVAVLLSAAGIGILFGLIPLAALTTQPANRTDNKIVDAFK